MASNAHGFAESRAVRDPVLLLPLAVAAGLAVGWLRVHERVAGTRKAADLALSWALMAASLVALERPRWRRARWLLAATPLALLGADLEWASSHALWTLGFLLEGLWAAARPVRQDTSIALAYAGMSVPIEGRRGLWKPAST